MKTAREWVEEHSSIKGTLGNLNVKVAKQIQIDALRHCEKMLRSYGFESAADEVGEEVVKLD